MIGGAMSTLPALSSLFGNGYNEYKNAAVTEQKSRIVGLNAGDLATAKSESAALRAAERNRQYGGAAPKGDTVNISEAAKALFNAYSSTAPASGDARSASMQAITSFGTLVQVEAHASTGGRKTFSAGGFGAQGEAEGLFKVRTSGQNAASAEALTYTATFTHANGEIQEFELKANTVFHELDDGSIILGSEDQKTGTLQGGKGRDILIALEDGTNVDGGEGDDILFNLGRGATLSGGSGNDVITSLGDGAKIDGGEGDDAIALLHDTLHPEDTGVYDAAKEQARESAGDDYRPYASQKLTVEGGDGNDYIMVKPELYQSSIRGGNGADVISVESATASVIDGGDGSDVITGMDLRKSTVLGGSGNDIIRFRDLFKSGIKGGDGDDWIEINNAESSALEGGAGNDLIIANKVKDSLVSGGAGNDLISVKEATGKSIISGGAGDDIIFVDEAGEDVVIGGGDGDDLIIAFNAGTVDGGNGDDTLIIKGGATRVFGGSGDDTILVGSLAEGGLIDGGDGDDFIHVGSIGKDGIVTGGSGSDTIRTPRTA